ncbi:hypothetical protein M0802_009634 [Mischocyttarus mexicanus]|nr:hypothetical protein M0802_009634 [Mischocyttarus mexicanus]
MFSSILRKSLFNVTNKKFRTSAVLKNDTMKSTKYETLSVSIPKPFVCMVQLNRPEKRNAMNTKMWEEIRECFDDLSMEPECRVIILSAIGKMFCAGLDLQGNLEFYQKIAEQEDVARKCKLLESMIRKYQGTITSIEKCTKPVIAAVHNACIGSGVDMISAADIRYCSSDAWFQIKEVDIGMAADVGTLQRFPKIIGSDSLVRELVYTARKFPAAEALQCGFVNRVYDSQESLLDESIKIAEEIASKSPVAVQGSKLSLVYSRDHSVQEGLEHIAMHNKSMLQSEDFINATTAQMVRGDPPTFSKL